MDGTRAGHPRQTSVRQIFERIDTMLAAGRICQEDAARLRSAAASGGLDEALQEIRLRHAKARVAEALSSGLLTPEGARAALERLDDGEDPRTVLRLAHRARPPVD